MNKSLKSIFHLRQYIDTIMLSILGTFVSLLEMIFYIICLESISGQQDLAKSNYEFIDDFLNTDGLIWITILTLITSKLIVIIYSSMSCEYFAIKLYKTAFQSFRAFNNKNDTEWDAIFTIHLNIVSNSIYRSVLSMFSAFAYFLVFLIYIFSIIEQNILILLIVSILLLLLMMGFIFYSFRKVSMILVESVNTHINFIMTLSQSSFYYFSGFKPLKLIIVKYNDVLAKFKRAQKFQQIFHEAPRFTFEIILIIFLTLIYYSNTDSNSSNGLVFLLLLRLMPIFSSIFANIANISSNKASLLSVAKAINIEQTTNTDGIEEVKSISTHGLVLKHNSKYKIYPDVELLCNSTIVRITGPSGSGKSSLLQSLVGRREISSGCIKINDMESLNKSLFDSVIYMTSDFEIPKILTLNNLLYSYPVHDQRALSEQFNLLFPELVERGIQLMEFMSFTGEYMKAKFSSGQKQRLAHFLALYSGSDIMVCDEGFCHMDEKLKKRIVEYYVEKQTYKAIILVAHDAEFLNDLDVKEINIASE